MYTVLAVKEYPVVNNNLVIGPMAFQWHPSGQLYTYLAARGDIELAQNSCGGSEVDVSIWSSQHAGRIARDACQRPQSCDVAGCCADFDKSQVSICKSSEVQQ